MSGKAGGQHQARVVHLFTAVSGVEECSLDLGFGTVPNSASRGSLPPSSASPALSTPSQTKANSSLHSAANKLCHSSENGSRIRLTASSDSVVARVRAAEAHSLSRSVPTSSTTAGAAETADALWPQPLTTPLHSPRDDPVTSSLFSNRLIAPPLDRSSLAATSGVGDTAAASTSVSAPQIFSDSRSTVSHTTDLFLSEPSTVGRASTADVITRAEPPSGPALDAASLPSESAIATHPLSSASSHEIPSALLVLRWECVLDCVMMTNSCHQKNMLCGCPQSQSADSPSHATTRPDQSSLASVAPQSNATASPAHLPRSARADGATEPENQASTQRREQAASCLEEEGLTAQRRAIAAAKKLGQAALITHLICGRSALDLLEGLLSRFDSSGPAQCYMLTYLLHQWKLLLPSPAAPILECLHRFTSSHDNLLCKHPLLWSAISQLRGDEEAASSALTARRVGPARSRRPNSALGSARGARDSHAQRSTSLPRAHDDQLVSSPLRSSQQTDLPLTPRRLVTQPSFSVDALSARRVAPSFHSSATMAQLAAEPATARYLPLDLLDLDLRPFVTQITLWWHSAIRDCSLPGLLIDVPKLYRSHLVAGEERQRRADTSFAERYAGWFHAFRLWLIHQILRRTTAELRTQALQSAITLGVTAHAARNYSLTLQVLCALRSPLILTLKVRFSVSQFFRIVRSFLLYVHMSVLTDRFCAL